MNAKTKKFLKLFHAAEKKYGPLEKRLAADGWDADWKMLIATTMSAQTRDEVTIPVAENLFRRYPTLERLANAKKEEVLKIISRVNFNRVKSKSVIGAARYMLTHYNGRVPDDMEQLLEIPGVGRKTANLVLSEIHSKDSVCIDTHCHRLLNVLGLVKTKNPTETEFAIMKIAPQRYWSKINRILVLWGQDIRGKDKKKILAKIGL